MRNSEDWNDLFQKSVVHFLKHVKPIKNRTTPLTNKQELTLLANKAVINAMQRAVKLLSEDKADRAFNIICNIPYTIVNPHPEIQKQQRYVGSDATYSALDKIRHYIRMMNTGPVGGNRLIWNSVMVLTA